MKKESKQKVESTNLTCTCCPDEIRNSQPYIRNGKPYCRLCEDRAKMGLLDKKIPRQYRGISIGG